MCTIRRAYPVDAPTIRAIARDSWHAAYGDFLPADTIDAVIDDWYALERLRRAIENEDHHVFVGTPANESTVSDDDDPVGFIHVAPGSAADTADSADDTLAVLPRLYVHPAHWGQGVGRSLLERAETALLADGFERLRLEVFAANDVGVGFYETTGFERCGAHTETFGGEPRRVYHFEKRLESL